MPEVRYNVPELMSAAPRITDHGRIADPEGFSAASALYNPAKTRFHLKPKNGRLDLEGVPENFHAVIRQAEDIHASDMEGQKNCALQIFQGLLAPGRNFGVIEPHIDTHLRGYPESTGVLEDSFIISDALTTKFYRQAFHLPAHMFAPPEDLYWRLSEVFREQAQPDALFIPEPYHLVRFGALTVHASQLPEVETRRTAAVLHFF